jgi:hypothetical protein
MRIVIYRTNTATTPYTLTGVADAAYKELND